MPETQESGKVSIEIPVRTLRGAIPERFLKPVYSTNWVDDYPQVVNPADGSIIIPAKEGGVRFGNKVAEEYARQRGFLFFPQQEGNPELRQNPQMFPYKDFVQALKVITANCPDKAVKRLADPQNFLDLDAETSHLQIVCSVLGNAFGIEGVIDSQRTPINEPVILTLCFDHSTFGVEDFKIIGRKLRAPMFLYNLRLDNVKSRENLKAAEQYARASGMELKYKDCAVSLAYSLGSPPNREQLKPTKDMLVDFLSQARTLNKWLDKSVRDRNHKRAERISRQIETIAEMHHL